MNRDVLESQWTQIRDILKEKFSNLTDEDIRQINGRYDQLVAKLQQKYGYTREEAEDRIRSWNFDRFSNPRSTIAREETVNETENSSLYKWILGIGIPLILLGSYFLTRTDTTPASNQEQIITETPSDRVVSNSVRNALIAQRQQNLTSALQNIRITTQDGVVTLSGFVPNRETRDLIVNTAQNSNGVRRVINNIEIR